MKQVNKISQNTHYNAVNIGKLDDVKSYSFIHPKTGKNVEGKVFLKDSTQSTGTEISFTTIASGGELNYFHKHNKDEETYIILKGSGFFQVDDDCFPITEGSVIKVSPEGARSLCNTSDTDMVYICVQSKEHSLEEYSTDDGTRVSMTPKWRL